MLVGMKTMIATAFFKKLRQMASRKTGKILLPSHELLQWNVGTYQDIMKNGKHGEVVGKLRFPIILRDREIVEAIEDGAIYHPMHEYTNRWGYLDSFEGFMKNGMANGPGIRTTSIGQLQDGNFKDDMLDGLCMIVYTNLRSMAELQEAEIAAALNG